MEAIFYFLDFEIGILFLYLVAREINLTSCSNFLLHQNYAMSQIFMINKWIVIFRVLRGYQYSTKISKIV